MSFRGGGRGRGRGGFGGGGFRPVKDVPFDPYPEIEGLGTAEYSTACLQLVKWTINQFKDCHLSPFYYEDRSDRPKRQILDIERYSDKFSQATKVKPPLWDVMHLDTDFMPAELARGGGEQRRKKLKWSGDSDWNKLERFEELEQKRGQGGEKDEDDEEDVVDGEDEGEFSDEGDYEQAEYCDDDEDDFNMADDNDDEPCY